MKSIEVIEAGKLAIKDKEEPEIKEEDEVLIRVKAAGICGSDLHILHGKNPFATLPRVIGHELAGEVIEVGPGVVNVKKGDKVTVNNVISCGECYSCSIGRPNVCKSLKALGVHIDGGFAEVFKISSKNVYKVPEKISFEEAALSEPYSIVAQSIDRGDLQSHDKVLICGAGPLGLMLVQYLKSRDIFTMVTDIVDSKLEKAKELGADVVINPLTENVNEVILANTNDEGASLIFEATGSIKVFEDSISNYSSQAGKVVVLGFPNENASVKPSDIMKKELSIVGSRVNNNKFPEVLNWMEEELIKPSEIISHRYSYKDIHEAMKLIENEPDKVSKVVIIF